MTSGMLRTPTAAGAHPRLVGWWNDDPADPGRLPLATPSVQRLAAAIAPGAPLTDLGGVMSLNVCLGPQQAGSLVLRVHQPEALVSRRRLLAQQAVRRALAGMGLRVPVAVPWGGSTVFRCGGRWAELEPYLPSQRPAPSLDSHVWLFGAMGVLHRALAVAACSQAALPAIPRPAETAIPRQALPVPRPIGAPFAPPGSLRRWLPVTEAAVRGDPPAAEVARLVRECARRLRPRWVPAAALPVQLVHGDVRLSNVRRVPPGQPGAGETVYFDFGFAAVRPRVHDLAYALAFTAWALDCLETPERFPWDRVPRLIEAYEAAAGWRLTSIERRALVPSTAAVPLFYAALDGFSEDPGGKLRQRRSFVGLSEWLLSRPATFLA